MRVSGVNQLTLDWEPSVRQRFPTLRQCIHYTVLQDPRGIAAVAMDCDLSESELSRRLNKRKEGHPRSCDVDLMVKIMHSTGNLLPLQWLAAEFSQDKESRFESALSIIETLAPQVLEAARVIREQAAAERKGRGSGR